MDFDKAIDDIIFKYKLDSYYPKYKKRKRAEEYLKAWVKKREEGEQHIKKILCLSASEAAISHVSFFTSNNRLFEYLRISTSPSIEESELIKISWEQYQQIWVISFEGEISIGEWLREHNISCYSLYDDFSMNGLEFEDEYYHIFSKKFSGCSKFKNFTRGEKENVFLEWYYLHTMYEETQDSNLKKYYLKKMFFLAVVQRNFVLAEKYKNQIKQFEEEAEIYDNVWNDIIEVLNEMTRRARERKQEDILMLWMDQLVYGSERDMPFVKQEMDAGIYFENAFTLFCNTYPTFRYLFTDVKENSIDLFSRKNVMNETPSKVCTLLKEHNYEFKVISSDFNHTNIKKIYCIDDCIDAYVSISALLWKALTCLLSSSEPLFLVIHELVQTHGPVMTSEMTFEMFENGGHASKLRMAQTLKDIDKQIAFYMSRIHENATRIYMSDHGTGDEVCKQMQCMLAVTGKFYSPQRVKEIFSYKNFYLLLRQILDKKVCIEDITCECAEIYAFPLYNRVLIGYRLQRGECFASDFEFCGCVTKDYVYIVMREGRELLLERKQLPTMLYILPHKKDICNEEMLPYFRSKVGTLHLDWDAKKWKYAKYYRQVYENWKTYDRNQMDEVNRYISESGCMKIGIRMGGLHSAVLFEWLEQNNQNRIVCIIDNNPECECAKFGKKIIRLEEMDQIEQDMVILSSFEHQDLLRRESICYPKNIKVFDIYRFLREKGYPNKAIYCDFKGMPDAGYDVGFPFED